MGCAHQDVPCPPFLTGFIIPWEDCSRTRRGLTYRLSRTGIIFSTPKIRRYSRGLCDPWLNSCGSRSQVGQQQHCPISQLDTHTPFREAKQTEIKILYEFRNYSGLCEHQQSQESNFTDTEKNHPKKKCSSVLNESCSPAPFLKVGFATGRGERRGSNVLNDGIKTSALKDLGCGDAVE